MKAILKIAVAVFFVAFVAQSCEKDRLERICEPNPAIPCAVDSAVVNFRVINKTGFDICDLVLKLDASDAAIQDFGALADQDSTCYIPIQQAFFSPGFDYRVGTANFSQEGGLIGGRINEPKTFVTYEIEVDQRLDTSATRGIQLVYFTYSRPVILNF